MPDSSIPITSGSGTNVDTRTESTNSNHRQVIVIGDPSANLGIVAVVSVPPTETSTEYGLVVRLAGSARVAQATAGTFAVYFDPANPAVNIGSGSFSVYLSSTAGTLHVKIDPSSVLSGVLSSVSVHVLSTGGTLQVKTDPSSTLSGIISSVAVYFDRGNPTVTANVGTGSSAVYFSSSNPKVNLGTDVLNVSHTAIVPQTASGSVSSQGGAGLNTVVSPEASRVIKVYAFSLTTTGQVNNNVRFTNGSSGGGGEAWRVALEAPAQGIAGANLAVTPPGYLFAMASNTTVALYLGEASLVHYSVAYFKESA